MPANQHRLGFLQEFGLPAVVCAVLAMMPQALLRAISRTDPVLFTEHPRAFALSSYAAHSWLFFMVTVIAIMLVAALLQQMQLRRIARTGR